MESIYFSNGVLERNTTIRRMKVEDSDFLHAEGLEGYLESGAEIFWFVCPGLGREDFRVDRSVLEV